MVLFDNVSYYLSPSLLDNTRSRTAALLDQNGAIAVPIERATHIISNTIDFEGCDLLKKEVACVTPYWVERAMELGQRQEPKYYSADKTMIFSGIVATSANLPPGDKELISSGIMELGGAWREGLTKDVTHLFVTNTNSDKYRTAVAFSDRIRIITVLPHWFDQCWSQQMRLPTKLFEFPDPPYFKKEHDTNAYKEQMSETRHKGNDPEHLSMEVDKSMMFQTLHSDVPAPSKPRNVWQGRIVLLASSLELDMDRRKALEERIERTGGIPIRCLEEEEPFQVAKVDVLITRFRSGPVYSCALKLGKTIGSFRWFLYVERSGVLSSPRDNLLHYPARPRPIPGFSAHEITVTNYQGEARDYLKRLIELMGAKFTPTLSGRNTVVVAAYKTGSKTDKAEEWSIPVVNHKWLEDCFVEWRNLTPAQKKYLDYAPGFNYSVLVGKRGVGRIGLEEDYDLLPKEAAALSAVNGEQRTKNNYSPGAIIEHSRLPVHSASKEALEVEEVDVALDLGHDDGIRAHRKSLSPSKNSSIRARTVATSKGIDTTKAIAIDGDEEDTTRAKLDLSKKPKSTRTGSSLKRVIIDTEEDGIVVSSSSPPIKPNLLSKAGKDRPFISPSELKSAETKVRRTETGDKVIRGRGPKGKGRPTESDEDPHPKRKAGEKSKQRIVAEKKPSTLVMEEEEEDEGTDSPNTKPEPIQANKKKGRSKPPVSITHHEEDSESESDTDQEPTQQSLKGKPKLSPRTYKTKTKTRAKATASSSDDESNSDLELVIPDGRNTIKVDKLLSLPQRSVAVELPSANKKRTISPTSLKSSSSTMKPISAARTSSIRAAAHEAPSSSSKRGRPSDKVPSSVSSRSPSPAPKRRKTKDRPPVASTDPKTARSSDVRRAVSVSSNTSMSVVIRMQRTPSRRGAAIAATQKLRDEVMPDVVNYEIERKRNAKGSVADRRPKGSLGASTTEDDEEDDEGQHRPQKKRKVVNPTKARKGSNMAKMQTDEESIDADAVSTGISTWKPKSIRVMTTKVEVPEDIQNTLNKLGVKFTQKPIECTHLITSTLARTEKFLCALPHTSFVLDIKWMKACADAGRIVSEHEYFLHDPDMEHKHGFKLVEALKRAKELKRKKKKLLEGQFFYFTPNVPVDHNLLKSVLRSLGAEGKDATPTARNLTTTRHVVSCIKDEPLWRPLAKQGKPVFSQEFILSAAFRQFVDWDSDDMYVPGSRP